MAKLGKHHADPLGWRCRFGIHRYRLVATPRHGDHTVWDCDDCGHTRTRQEERA